MIAPEEEIARRGEALLGTTLGGKWKLESVLGHGGVATVFAATHRNGKRVAIKVLHRELAESPTLRERFLEEGYLANAVGHPGAVEVLDDDSTDDGLVFLVMELLEGETLRERIEREGRLSWQDAATVGASVLRTVAAAHEKRIVHRDLKPDNIFLTDQGATKVLDFGIARITDSSRTGRRSTRFGLMMGTPGFMPPEQLRGQWDRVGPSTDVWALGATLFTAMTGRLLYDEIGPSAFTPAPPVRTLRPEIPPNLGTVVDRALAIVPALRFKSAGEMLTALERAIPDALPRSSSRPASTLGSADTRRSIAPRSAPPLDNVAPVEIAPKTFWVGKRDARAIFHANPYYRDLGDGRGLLIDPGSSSDFAIVSAKVASISGSLRSVAGMFINHQDPDVGSSATVISGRHAPDAAILSSEPTWRLIVHQNLPADRFVEVPSQKRPFEFEGHELVAVPSPFCHFRGAVMLYDPETRVLFSGDLLGGLTEPTAQGLWADATDWSGVRAFHQAYMPTNRVVASTIRTIRSFHMPIDVIAPQHGRLLRGAVMETFLERLERLPVGFDLLDEIGEGPDALAAWSSVLNRVLHTARLLVGEETVDGIFHDEQLAEHVTRRGGRADVSTGGRWTISTAVRLLTQGREAQLANVITLEALHACEELELPSPEIVLERQALGDRPATII